MRNTKILFQNCEKDTILSKVRELSLFEYLVKNKKYYLVMKELFN